MIIRKAEPDDIEALWELHSRSVRELNAEFYTPAQIESWVSNRTPADYLRRMQADPFLVAVIEKQIVGYARYRPQTRELCSVFVSPDHSRQGIGRRLVYEILALARAEGLTDLWLDSSLSAVSFYESFGFELTCTTTHTFSGEPLDCRRMSLTL